MPHRCVVLILGVFVVVSSARTVSGASTPGQKCEAEKLRAAGKRTACRTTALAKIAVGSVGDLAKCDLKFAHSFSKAEAKGGCFTSGDSESFATRLDAATQDLFTGLSGVRLINNGDGTVTDTSTGLQWERKTEDGGIHDVSKTFTWSTDEHFGPLDGTINTFTPQLNDGCESNDGIDTTATGFAGHCDWRLPTVQELATIVDTARCSVFGGPCVSLMFGATAPATYVTITAWDLHSAWASISARAR